MSKTSFFKNATRAFKNWVGNTPEEVAYRGAQSLIVGGVGFGGYQGVQLANEQGGNRVLYGAGGAALGGALAVATLHNPPVGAGTVLMFGIAANQYAVSSAQLAHSEQQLARKQPGISWVETTRSAVKVADQSPDRP